MAGPIPCYSMKSNIASQNSLFFPCENLNSANTIMPCCAVGDNCMSDWMCHYMHSEVGGSGWYSAACTDPSGDANGCIVRCSKLFSDALSVNNTNIIF